MKTLSLFFSSLAALCICFTATATNTNTTTLPDQPALQVYIKAKFIETTSAETLGIKFSCLTTNDSLDFLDGVTFVPDLFTVTNTQRSISAFNFHKLNGKKTKAIFKAKGPDEKHLVLLKIKKGILSGKIKNRNGFLRNVPQLTGIPLLPTDSVKNKSLLCKLNILNEIQALGPADIRYSVNKNLIMLIKPVILISNED